MISEWDLPEPTAGAEWVADKSFNPAEEILRDPALKEVFKSALDKANN